MKNNIVIKIGGSILYDHLLNVNFDLFKRFKQWYSRNKKEYDHIVFVVGGGRLSREMGEKVSESIKREEGIHSVAMSVTQTNAEIIASYIGGSDIFVPKRLGEALEYLHSDQKGLMVSGGLKIGWSTDMDAAIFADTLGVDKVHKVSNVDYIYDKDPKEFFDAKPIKDITWKAYFKMFSILPDVKHVPNSHIPVDVECSLFCARKNIAFNITGGKLLYEDDSLGQILQQGTLIHN